MKRSSTRPSSSVALSCARLRWSVSPMPCSIASSEPRSVNNGVRRSCAIAVTRKRRCSSAASRSASAARSSSAIPLSAAPMSATSRAREATGATVAAPPATCSISAEIRASGRTTQRRRNAYPAVRTSARSRSAAIPAPATRADRPGFARKRFAPPTLRWTNPRCSTSLPLGCVRVIASSFAVMAAGLSGRPAEYSRLIAASFASVAAARPAVSAASLVVFTISSTSTSRAAPPAAGRTMASARPSPSHALSGNRRLIAPPVGRSDTRRPTR